MNIITTQPADIAFSPPAPSEVDLAYILDAIHDFGFIEAESRHALTLVWVQIFCEHLGAWSEFDHLEFYRFVYHHKMYYFQVVNNCVTPGYNSSVGLRTLSQHGLMTDRGDLKFQINEKGIRCLEKAWGWCRGRQPILR